MSDQALWRVAGWPGAKPSTFADDVLQATDGSILRWRAAENLAIDPAGVRGKGVPVTISVSAGRPGHSVTVEYRVNGGSIREIAALPEVCVLAPNARMFQAILPGPGDCALEYLPVLRLFGQPVSPRLSEVAAPSRQSIPPVSAVAASAGQVPRWSWGTKFLFNLKAKVREQPVGQMPDGIRVNWQVDEGSFAGPRISGTILHGTGDWMRIREDGVAIVDVRACLETSDGACLSVTYGGILDLGPDGYAKAQRGEFVASPPLMVTPVIETSDARFAWLNREQCVGVGRVDTAALTYDFDIYSLQVGEPIKAG